MALSLNGTSGISGIDGSAATPAIQGSDTNTGISFGTDTVNINTGGTTRATVDSSGRFGIGTTSPGEPLSVATSSPGASATLARLQNTGTTSGTEARLLLSTSTSTGGTVSSGIACIATDAVGNTALALGTGTAGSYSEKARLDSSGRLLVGTSSTSGNATLHVNKGSAAGTDAGGLLLTNMAAMSSIGAGDDLGYINFGATTTGGVASYDAARILCEADATWGTNDYPSRLVFSVTADGASSTTARMELKNDGGIRLFPNASQSVNLSSAKASGTTDLFFVGKYGATGFDSGTNAIIVYTNGNVVNANNSYGSLSDIKLKENIVDANSQWDDLKALQVRNYNFKEGQTHTQIGLIAQEVELVSPGLVTESPDRDEEGNDLGTVTKSVNYSVLYMKAVKALQEAMERIETLETRVAQLEGGAS